MVEAVLRERMVVALPEGHALAARKRLTLADLDGQPMILYPNLPLPGLAQRVAAAFAREGVRLRIEQEVEDVLTSTALVAGGFGLCITTGIAYRALDCEALRGVAGGTQFWQGSQGHPVADWQWPQLALRLTA